MFSKLIDLRENATSTVDSLTQQAMALSVTFNDQDTELELQDIVDINDFAVEFLEDIVNTTDDTTALLRSLLGKEKIFLSK